MTAEVTLHGENDSYHLSAVLGVHANGIDQATARLLMEDAHQLYPYSKATRGNVAVQLVAVAAA